MACGATLTLKRSCVDFELMHCRPAKRQRCSLTTSPLVGHKLTANTQAHKSAFSDAVPRLTNGNSKSDAYSNFKLMSFPLPCRFIDLTNFTLI